MDCKQTAQRFVSVTSIWIVGEHFAVLLCFLQIRTVYVMSGVVNRYFVTGDQTTFLGDVDLTQLPHPSSKKFVAILAEARESIAARAAVTDCPAELLCGTCEKPVDDVSFLCLECRTRFHHACRRASTPCELGCATCDDCLTDDGEPRQCRLCEAGSEPESEFSEGYGYYSNEEEED